MLAEAAPLPASARGMLLALATILLVLLGAVVALAIALRRQQGARAGREARGGEREASARAAGETALAVTLACPTCRREYDGGLRFCPRDARALVPAAELSERGRGAGSTCPRCRRSFESGLKYCPYDAADLVPAGVYETTREDRDEAEGEVASGILGRICPRCRRRYDLVASFCGRDGCELAVLN